MKNFFMLPRKKKNIKPSFQFKPGKSGAVYSNRLSPRSTNPRSPVFIPLDASQQPRYDRNRLVSLIIFFVWFRFSDVPTTVTPSVLPPTTMPFTADNTTLLLANVDAQMRQLEELRNDIV